MSEVGADLLGPAVPDVESISDEGKLSPYYIILEFDFIFSTLYCFILFSFCSLQVNVFSDLSPSR